MSRRWVYTFQPRFAELVASGAKRQTIRGRRKDGLSPALGDVLSLRAWVGRPRASKQRLLRPECPCVAIAPIIIHEDRIELMAPFSVWGLFDFTLTEIYEEIAKRDGFAGFADMLAWFREVHGLPFAGTLIRW